MSKSHLHPSAASAPLPSVARRPRGAPTSARTYGRSAPAFTYSLRRDDSDFVVFCFAKPEDAEAFAKCVGGELFLAGR